MRIQLLHQSGIGNLGDDAAKGAVIRRVGEPANQRAREMAGTGYQSDIRSRTRSVRRALAAGSRIQATRA